MAPLGMPAESPYVENNLDRILNALVGVDARGAVRNIRVA